MRAHDVFVEPAHGEPAEPFAPFKSFKPFSDFNLDFEPV
jgi:hypothetical protein